MEIKIQSLPKYNNSYTLKQKPQSNKSITNNICSGLNIFSYPKSYYINQISFCSKKPQEQDITKDLKQLIEEDKKSSKPIILSYKEGFLDNLAKRLQKRPNDKILISITGESASGKSTICSQIAKTVQEDNLPVTILNADTYFNDISDLIKIHGTFDKVRDAGYDVDSPDNFYLDQLREDIIQLQQGHDVLAPKYLVDGTGISKPKAIPVKSQNVIIVEGIASTYDKVSDVFDVKVYVDLDEKTREERFMKRAKTRNQDDENAQKHWKYVKDAGRKYVSSHKNESDIIIDGDCDLNYLSKIIKEISLITNNNNDK